MDMMGITKSMRVIFLMVSAGELDHMLIVICARENADKAVIEHII